MTNINWHAQTHVRRAISAVILVIVVDLQVWLGMLTGMRATNKIAVIGNSYLL